MRRHIPHQLIGHLPTTQLPEPDPDILTIILFTLIKTRYKLMYIINFLLKILHLLNQLILLIQHRT